MAAKWEYRVSWIYMKYKHQDADKLNDHMAQWASKGWELLNASSTSYATETFLANITGNTTSNPFVQHSFYWRRPIG